VLAAIFCQSSHFMRNTKSNTPFWACFFCGPRKFSAGVK
jgi:hypothetical protein